MNPWKRLVVVVVIAMGAYLYGRCPGDPYNPAQPSGVIDSLNVLGDKGGAGSLDFGETIPLHQAPFKRSVEPRRAGIGPETKEARERNVRYAAKVLRSQAIPLPAGLELAPADTAPQMPFVRVTGTGALNLAAERSDSRIVRADYDCGKNRKIEAGTDGPDWFAHCERALPALLPRIGKGVAKCVAVAAAGYGVAYVVDYEKPELVAAGSGAACAVVQMF